MKRLHTIKVGDEEWAVWKTAAVSEGLPVSAWIRKRCEPLLPGKTPESLLTLTRRAIDRLNECD